MKRTVAPDSSGMEIALVMRQIETPTLGFPPVITSLNSGSSRKPLLGIDATIVAEGGRRRHLSGAAEGRIVEQGQILGREAGEAYRRKEGVRGGRPQACDHHASHVARRDRLPVRVIPAVKAP